MKSIFTSMTLCIVLCTIQFGSFAQLSTCSGDVPYYSVNLSTMPNGQFISPAHQRQGNCCSTSSPSRCTSFEVTFSPSSKQFTFFIAAGTVPSGTLYYQVNCGAPIPLGEPYCLTSPGPHTITFCHPGNEWACYGIKADGNPIFPNNIVTRVGCSKKWTVKGLKEASITWNSISPGLPGEYNSLLSCNAGCSEVTFTPDQNTPTVVNYQVCGESVASGCGGSQYICKNIKATTESPLTVSVNPNNVILCENESVTLVGSSQGGYSEHDYQWFNSEGVLLGISNILAVNQEGIYTFQVQDALYDPQFCPAVATSVPVTQNPTPIANAGADVETCANNNTVVLNGTAQNYSSVQWIGGNGTFSPSANASTVSYTPTLAELNTGFVSLSFISKSIDPICPNDTDQVHITYNPVPSVLLANNTISCYGDQITLNTQVASGTEPFNYLWSTGQSNSSILVGSGSYSVTVSDSKGCTALANKTITEPSLLSMILSSTDVSSIGGTDGTATIIASDGTAPYSYLWSTGQTTSTINNLTTGIYSVTVTDANNCQIIGAISINEPTCNSFNGTFTSNAPSCYGNNDGSIQIELEGGTLPYTYLWNDSSNQNGFLAQNLSSGYYTVTVEDAVGCQFVQTYFLDQPSALELTTVGFDATQWSGSDGMAIAIATGGTAPYNYFWNDALNQNNDTAFNLTAGTYQVTVLDLNGCTNNQSVEISEPYCANFGAELAISSITCNGDHNGTIKVTSINGSSPVMYSINGGTPLPTDSISSSLYAGTYYIQVMDSNNCQVLDTVHITEPDPILITGEVTNIKCFGEYNGSINVTISGGTFPYSIKWSDSLEIEDRIDLPASVYTIQIEDQNACIDTAQFQVLQPNELSYTAVEQNISCYTENTGSILVNVSGGTTPYTYAWSTGANTNFIDQLPAGQYGLEITDSNNCYLQVVPDFILDGPAEHLYLNITTNCPDEDSNYVNISVNIDGGAPPYALSINDSNAFTTSGISIKANPGENYSFYIKDSYGCEKDASISVPRLLNLEITKSDVTIYGGADGEAEAMANGGVPPYSYIWDTEATTTKIMGLIAGVYEVKATDANNCSNIKNVEILQPSILEIPNGFTPNGDGYNDYFVVRGLEAFEQNRIYIYNRWGNIVFEMANYNNDWTGVNSKSEDLPDGTYFVIVEVDYKGETIKLDGFIDLRR